MKRTLLCTALLTATLALPAASWASDDYYGRLTPEFENQIRQTLTEQGYDVRKVKMDDGLYEAYALKDGARFEIYLDRDLKVLRIKNEN